MSAEAEVRAVVTGWVDAVARRDLDGVVAHHTEDVVMFDVPPPYGGIRGIADYRDCWGPFFEWQATGNGTFELVELTVTAGSDVAFAYGLLRCGTPEDFERNPDNRLRVTMGLRRVDGEWLIAHEHHSFPMLS
ncbi:hypothetical protein MARA_55180 [Mycolicibacterium arabiense]|uniref:SnoaL-like domain-containing protein n=1 Tax=Mycolicibacterium arabiense TaxID=1286181 RepID=A0A7I7S6E3_9MYCO|nr:SgcJ/EcaC family oxidoreductase [Mycolicibacterium arabiense]MCV7372776.1 SgcJ/EcaC family oxidoreductase [Mycolicibacterium arabiense]BBY52050.1 hypothetical protein MARA_55180 [Mycolicibacterium arabiense]